MLSLNSLPVRARRSATPPEVEMASNGPAAEQPSSPSTGSETSLIQLPVRSHPAVHRAAAPVRTASDMTVVFSMSKAKAKKHASAAPMLKKKKGKVVKKRSQAKKSRKARTPSKRALAHRVTAHVDDARLAIMAKEDAACNNIFKTFMATIEGSAADDAAFVQSLNDAVDLLTAPLELEQVESTFSRESSHVTEVVVMRERIQAYEEHVKSHEAAMAAYWRDWEDMHDKFLQLGVEVLGKDAFAATEATDIAMTDAFIQKMERIHIDHNAMVDDLAIKMQAVEAGLMDEQRTIEEEFETSARNAKAMLFESLI